MSQRIQFWNSLSTADNTFHIYGICLNRNRMIQAHSQNGNTIILPKWEFDQINIWNDIGISKVAIYDFWISKVVFNNS